MSRPDNRHLLLKTLLLGSLLAGMVYFFHPDVGQFNLLINGQPVADPLYRLAAIPVLLSVAVLIGVLAALAIMGVGMLIFFTALGFALLGIFLVAPYSWPILLLFCLMMLAMSSNGSGKQKD
ncbi:hypothetical protein ACH50O_08400 [Methylomonas sp. 2BW1-5-20]|uniref:hypothetical protein n=1 Tax=Methylomonas sp. 2BW1-5-20 TaxID=3376686 RepID=UPI00404CA9FF